MIDRTIWQRWLNLQEDGSPSLLIQLIELFLDTAGSSVQEIQDAAQRNYAKGVAFHAHALKSSAASLGATQMADICLRIEKFGREENLTDIPQLLQQLKAEHETVSQELRAELIQLKGA